MDVFGEVGVVSGRVRSCRIIVGTISAMLVWSRYVFDDVG